MLTTLMNTTLKHIAREYITNIIKHARGARRAEICFQAYRDRVSLLSLWNELDPSSESGHSTRFGPTRLEGRAKVHCGSIDAGQSGGGWLVESSLPSN